MELQDILRLKFPMADMSKDIILCDEGAGAFIKYWNLVDIPIPSEQDLQQWKQEVLTLYQQEQFNDINKDVLSQLEEIDKKSIRALRANDTDRLQQLEEEAVQLRQQLIKV